MSFSLFTTVSIGFLTVIAGTAQAGEFLRLKAGDFRTSEVRPSARVHDNHLFVVQFKSTIAPDAASRLQALGLEPLRYLPDDAYLVRGQAESARLAREALPGVNAVVDFQPEWKLSEELQAPLSSAAMESLLVTAVDEQTAYTVSKDLRTLQGVQVRGVNGTDVIVDASPARALSIAEVDGVEWIEKMPLFVTWDYQAVYDGSVAAPPVGGRDYVYTGHESGTKLMNFPAAWSRGFEGAGQIVGEADTGLDLGKLDDLHPDFQGNVYKGFAIGLGGHSWQDSMGHGTHVAGSILGNGAKSSQRIMGGAHKARLVMVGMWSDLLDNLAPGTDFEKIIGTAYNEGARIHSNSWGAPASNGAYDSFASKVDDYMWKHPDMLVLFAAGNEGVDHDRDGHIDEGSVSTPGTSKNTLTVGASENELFVGGIQRKLGELRDGDKNWGVPPLKDDTLSNNGNGIACFSSRGPTQDGRLKPEIVAPGTNIISVKSRHPKASLLWGAFNDDYVYAGGTSMATPLTAGAAAVAREYLIKARGVSNPSAALLKATMIHTAKDLYPGQYGTGPQQELPTRRPNVHEGYGRVDMDAVTRIGSETQLVDEADGVGTGEQKVYKVTVGQSGSLRATLSYTDAPASPSAGKALVNDIDLVVVSPSGQTFTKDDHVNNSEMLELSDLPAGEYQVVVKGVNVPQGKSGKQPFGLVISQN